MSKYSNWVNVKGINHTRIHSSMNFVELLSVVPRYYYNLLQNILKSSKWQFICLDLWNQYILDGLFKRLLKDPWTGLNNLIP